MSRPHTLICRSCGQTIPSDRPIWRCECGGLLDLNFTPELDPDRVSRRKPTMWRYREAIPIRQGSEISFDEGFTPLLPLKGRGATALVKQEQHFPTGSYKDRGAAVLISKVKELGLERVVEDSSGNAGCAVAAYCASAGIACEIFVPQDTAAAKTAQITLYGADLVLTPGPREATARAVLKAAEHAYYASHSYNPYFFHGTKTFAYEVAEQLGWKSPDTLVLPAGNGTLLLGAHLGFSELIAMGLVARMPRIIAVQSAACAPLATAFEKGLDGPARIESSPTWAEGIAIAEPVRGKQIMEAVAETNGHFLAVEEEEIKEAVRLAASQGFYIEPSSGAAVAGLLRHMETMPGDEVVVSAFTGHGLKALEKMLVLAGAK